MHSAALMAQGALMTNMASLLQRNLTATLQTECRAVAKGEKDLNAYVAIAAAPSHTITRSLGLSDATTDLDVEEEDDDEVDDEESLFKDL